MEPVQGTPPKNTHTQTHACLRRCELCVLEPPIPEQRHPHLRHKLQQLLRLGKQAEGLKVHEMLQILVFRIGHNLGHTDRSPTIEDHKSSVNHSLELEALVPQLQGFGVSRLRILRSLAIERFPQ